MSEILEIRTGREVSEVVERLAREMGDDRLCLPVQATVPEGEWVRFSVVLEDGTPVIEGVGRSKGTAAQGGASKRLDLYLGELDFDARNEIMYERMLIAKQAGRRGDHTGAMKLPDVAMLEEDLQEDLQDDVQDAASPPTRSVPPPPPAARLDGAPRLPSKPPPAMKPPTADGSKTAGSGTDAKTKPVAPSAQKPPVAPSAQKPSVAASPNKPAVAASPKPGGAAASLEGETTRVDFTAPPARETPSRPSRIPRAIADGPYALEVPHALVAHARRLEERLPRKLTSRDRTPKHPEAAVLTTALRIGLAALEALTDED